MKKNSNIIKESILVLLIFVFLLSCNKKKSVDYLPVNNISIIEYRYMTEGGWKFQVVGFCKLDKNFNMKSVLFGYDGFYYCNTDFVVVDSLKNKISEIILNYPSDTTFLFPRGSRIYDGNSYRFIIEKFDSEKTVINFLPDSLPKDLLFLYRRLYGDRQDSLKKDSYKELFEKFENQIKSELYNVSNN